MKSDKPALNNQIYEVANTLAMHTAAMKPSYLNKEEVPQSAKDQAIAEQKEQTLAKLKEGTTEQAREKAIAGAEKSAVSKLLKAEVLLEQDLATSEASETVAQYLKSSSEKIGAKIEIRSWALFQIK